MSEKPTLEQDEPVEPVEFDLEADGTLPGGGRGLLPESVKKALLAGVGALFTTEEGARRMAREWKLPKDVMGFIGQQASSAKEEILRVVSDEFRRFLESDAVHRELQRALESMTIEVHAEIRLRRGEDGSPQPEVKASARPVRTSRRKGKK